MYSITFQSNRPQACYSQWCWK